jgi:hypothetical protein
MKKNFKNKIEVKTAKTMVSPWDFTAPHYDERSSCYVNAGTHHGVGHRQPVGSTTYSTKGAVPVGKGMGMTVDEIPVKNLVIGFEE